MVTFICILFFPLWVFAGNENRKSLQDPEFLVEKTSGRARVRSLNKLAKDNFHISPTQSLEYSKRALFLSRDINDYGGEVTALSQMGEVYDKLGQSNRAMVYYYHALRVYSKHEQRKEKEERFRILAAVVILTLSVSVVILLGFLYFRHRRIIVMEKKRITGHERQLQLEANLRLFQARIRPHFLFNSLDALVDPDCGKDPEKLKDTVLKLSNLYRAILDSPEIKVTTLQNELAVVGDYLAIEKALLNDRLDYEIIADESLYACEMLPLTILTLVENAVKHGIHQKRDGGSVCIQVEREGESLRITISDTGTGFDPEKVNYGFGIYSIQERFRLFYQDNARLKLNSDRHGGTQAIMEVPYATIPSSAP